MSEGLVPPDLKKGKDKEGKEEKRKEKNLEGEMSE